MYTLPLSVLLTLCPLLPVPLLPIALMSALLCCTPTPPPGSRPPYLLPPLPVCTRRTPLRPRCIPPSRPYRLLSGLTWSADTISYSCILLLPPLGPTGPFLSPLLLSAYIPLPISSVFCLARPARSPVLNLIPAMVSTRILLIARLAR